MQHITAEVVHRAASHSATASSSNDFLPGRFEDPADSFGIRPTLQLNTHSISSSFFPAALQLGIVLYKPFGGICSGLEMCLRNDLTIKQYLYSDNDPTATSVAAYRISQLQQRYPQQLPSSALEGTFSQLPADVTRVSLLQLANIAAQQPHVPWLVVAGFPCQEFSMAGPSRGLAGQRSQLLYTLVNIVGALQQQLQPPPGYIIYI